MEFSWHCQNGNSYKDNAHLFCINISHSQKKWPPQVVLHHLDSYCLHCCSLWGTTKHHSTNSNGYSDLSVSPGSVRAMETGSEGSQQGRMVRSRAGLGCCLALAPSVTILIPSHKGEDKPPAHRVRRKVTQSPRRYGGDMECGSEGRQKGTV